MELISSVTELLEEMGRLEGQPIAKHSGFVKGIGNYFKEYRPSQIDEIYVQMLEQYFNSLYTQIADNDEKPEITSAVLSILGTISHQCKKIEKDTLDIEYFITFKPLGDALTNLGELLEQE